jgi:hypothetical protein
MRTSPIVGDKAWFGPRRLGWGLEPVSPEGWIVVFGVAGLVMALRRYQLRSAWFRYPMLGAFLVLAVLKGTAPGGPAARFDFEEGKLATLRARTEPAAGSD